MDLFREEQKISLFFCKNDTMVEIVCTLDKVYDDRLELILPQYFMRYIEFLQVGKSLTAKAFSKFGTVDFNTIIITSPLEECFTIELDYNSLKLTPGAEIPFIRAVENLDVVINNSVQSLKTFEISTENIKFTSDKKLEINEIIDCVLNLPKDYGIISFKATIVEVDPIYENEYTAEYLTMTELGRQALLYYMYMYTKDID